MFKVNDTVLYGTEGVCRITELTERDFRGKKVKYYVLKPEDVLPFILKQIDEA